MHNGICSYCSMRGVHVFKIVSYLISLYLHLIHQWMHDKRGIVTSEWNDIIQDIEAGPT